MKTILYAAIALIATWVTWTPAFADTVLPFGEFLSFAMQAANCTPNNTTENWCVFSGIGTDGDIACTDGWYTLGEINCWLYTGGNPTRSGYVELPTNQLLKSPGRFAFAICVVSIAVTENSYVLDYFAEDWPLGSTAWQDQSRPDGAGNQAAFLWFGWQSPIALTPYATYSLHMFCPPKPSSGT